MVSAAQAANAHDFIATKPDGYDTWIGERGSGLSGGEKQRISLARAILHNPRILILDEATSSVDTETAQLIQSAIETVLKGRIAFVIAHRLSTIRNAALILVIDDGRIVEQGTHADLIGREGRYWRRYTRQEAEEAEARLGE